MGPGTASLSRRRLAVCAAGLVLAAACAGSGDASPRSQQPSSSAPTTAGHASTGSVAPTTVPVAPATTTKPSTPPTTAPAGPPPLALEEGPLQRGSRGLRTLLLQQRLKDLRFDPGEPDGAFGSKTAMAIWSFQALRGQPQSGVVSPELEHQILLAPPEGMLRPDLGPTHTEVDLDKQVLLVFEGGGVELVSHVSTGTGRRYCDEGRCGVAVTPPGDFHYQRRISGWRVAPLGRLYNPVYFNGGIAVHGAPSVPAYPASHGCVRIPMHVAQYFPGLVADGEPIAVFRGSTGAAAPVTAPAAGVPPAPPDTLAGD